MTPLRAPRPFLASTLLFAAFLGQVVAQTPPASEPPATGDDQIVVLSPFEVVSEEDFGYTASNVISGTRVNEAIRDLPLNISVLTEELLQDLKSDTLTSALEFTSGVNFEDERNMSFQVRGYRVWIPRRNGFRGAHPWFQTANVERVEFIRGPASVLYGDADPGGIINTITKRPKPKPRVNVAVTTGSWGYRRADFDWNQPLSDDGKVLSRFNLSYRDGDTFSDFGKDSAFLAAGSLLWKPFERTTVVLDYEYTEVDRRLPGQIPRFSDPPATSPYAERVVNYWDAATQSYVGRPLGTSYPTNRFFNYRFATDDRSFSFNGPAMVDSGDSYMATLEITHQFSRDLTARLAYQYGDRFQSEYRFGGAGLRNEDGYFQGNSINPNLAYTTNGRTIGIMGNTHIRGYGVQADVAWIKEFGGIENKFIVFAEQSQSLNTNDRYVANRLPAAERLPNPANIAVRPGEPVVYNDPPWSPEKFVRFSDSKSETRAVSFSNQVALFEKRWRLLAGARWQRTGYTETISRWTPQFGTTFRLTPDLTIYGLMSESFTEQFQRKPEDGSWVDPVAGEGAELGLKFDLMERKVSGMVALFQTKRINQWSTIPLDPPNPDQFNPSSQSVYRDEESKGVEVDLMVVPSRHWQITAGYAYTDSEVTANPGERNTGAVNWPSIVGTPLANTPKHRFNLWNRYNFAAGSLKGLYVGGGVIYSGNRVAQVDGRTPFLYLGSYARLDALVGYRFNWGERNVDLSVRVENLFDEFYLRSQNSFGAPRNFKATIRTNF